MALSVRRQMFVLFAVICTVLPLAGCSNDCADPLYCFKYNNANYTRLSKSQAKEYSLPQKITGEMLGEYLGEVTPKLNYSITVMQLYKYKGLDCGAVLIACDEGEYFFYAFTNFAGYSYDAAEVCGVYALDSCEDIAVLKTYKYGDMPKEINDDGVICEFFGFYYPLKGVSCDQFNTDVFGGLSEEESMELSVRIKIYIIEICMDNGLFHIFKYYPEYAYIHDSSYYRVPDGFADLLNSLVGWNCDNNA